eukprot:363547-Chlamydomonas_euryale.AAC.11
MESPVAAPDHGPVLGVPVARPVTARLGGAAPAATACCMRLRVATSDAAAAAASDADAARRLQHVLLTVAPPETGPRPRLDVCVVVDTWRLRWRCAQGWVLLNQAKRSSSGGREGEFILDEVSSSGELQGYVWQLPGEEHAGIMPSCHHGIMPSCHHAMIAGGGDGPSLRELKWRWGAHPALHSWPKKFTTKRIISSC